jgi:allantoicase
MSYQRIPLEDFEAAFAATTGDDQPFLVHRSLPHVSASELSSVALGGKIISVSDEFFAKAYHLLLVEVRTSSFDISHSYYFNSPRPASKASSGPMVLYTAVGKADDITPVTIGEDLCINSSVKSLTPLRCIVKLGCAGRIIGFDIDTTHFNGANM